jgi:hypothetical protein
MRRSEGLTKIGRVQGSLIQRGPVYLEKWETGRLDVGVVYPQVGGGVDRDAGEFPRDRDPSEGVVSPLSPSKTLDPDELREFKVCGHHPGPWPTQRLLKIRLQPVPPCYKSEVVGTRRLSEFPLLVREEAA